MIYSSFTAILTFGFISSQRTTTAFVVNPSRAMSTQGGAFTTSTAILSAAKDGAVIDLLDSNFESLFNAEKPLLIDAYATFCGPCKLIEHVIKSCAQNWSDSLVVSRWNIEALQTNVKIELLLQGANPRKLPSLILVHQGKATQIHSGLISEDQLDDLLSELLPLKTVELATTPMTQPKTSMEDEDPSNDEMVSERKTGFINFAMDTADDYMLTFGE